MTSSQAQLVRAKIVRAGITERERGVGLAYGSVQFARNSWGFADGSVLVHEPHPARARDADDKAKTCGRMWRAFNPR